MYKIGIIGAGRIAGGYDDLQSEHILTHARAIAEHSGTELTGVHDISPEQTQIFAHKWRTQGFESAKDLVEKVDIVVIATPDHTHEEWLEYVIQFPIKAVICEKPIGRNTRKLKEILQVAKKKNIQIAVNFTRRYDSFLQKFRQEVQNQTFGKVLNFSAIYTKGILHNGSHLIDWLRFVFGEITEKKVLAKNIDYQENDPTLDVFLRFENGAKGHLLAADENCYSIFEIDVLFAKKRFSFLESGFKCRIQTVRPDPLFPNYYDLDEGELHQSEQNKSMLTLYQNITEAVRSNKPLWCSGEEALRTQEICQDLVELSSSL